MKFYIYNNQNLESVSWQEYDKWKRKHAKEYAEPVYDLDHGNGIIHVQIYYDGILNDTEPVKPFWVICAKTFMLSGNKNRKNRGGLDYIIDNIEVFEKWDDALVRFIEITKEVNEHQRLYDIISPIKFTDN